MTNTLHRYGDRESLRDDYVVFAMPARGVNDRDAPARLQQFLRLALPHDPINMGDARKGGIYHPDDSLNPMAHWRRRERIDLEEVIEGIDACTTASVVFDSSDALAGFLRDVRAADLGISVNIAALTDEADRCCRRAGLVRHSVEYSLGFIDPMDKLPDRRILELSTMCGHGMVSANFAQKMVEWVRAGRRTPKQASRYLAKFCTCGVYNTVRADRILRAAAVGE